MFGLSAPFSGEGSPGLWILDKSADESGLFLCVQENGHVDTHLRARDTNMRFHSPPSVSLVKSERLSLFGRF